MVKYLYILLLVFVIFLLPGSGKASCSDIEISVDKEEGCVYEVFSFSAVNGPADADYKWMIGPDTLYRDNPSTLHDFIVAGTFDVNLEVTLNDGSVCNLSRPDSIVINENPPEPVINISKDTLCNLDQSVNVSTSTTEGVEQYEWIVGQNSFEHLNTTSVSHSFNSPGFKEVSLRVTNEHGCRTTKVVDSAILAFRKPEIDFEDKQINECLPINETFTYEVFDEELSYNIDDKIWEFKNTDQGSITDHGGEIEVEATERGLHDVVLTVKGDNGCVYEYDAPQSVNGGKHYDIETSVQERNLCVLDWTSATITEPEEFQGNVEWNFPGEATDTSKYYRTQDFYFTQPGNYDVSVQIIDEGCISEHDIPENFHVANVDAAFEFDPECACEPPLTVNFEEKASAENTEIETYSWSFNGPWDNKTSNDPDPSITYTEEGEYEAILTVYDTMGCFDTESKKNVPYIKELKAEAEVDYDPVCVGEEATFSGPQKPYCNDIIDEYEWVFYDLNGEDTLKTSTSQNPIMVYDKPGFYDVFLSVKDEQGCESQIHHNNFIQAVDLDVKEVNDTFSICQFDTLQVENLAMGSSTASISSSQWKFYRVGERDNPVKTFNDLNLIIQGFDLIGEFDLELVVYSEEGCTETFWFENFLFVNGVDADFSLDKNKGCPVFSVNAEAEIKELFFEGEEKNIDTLEYTWSVSRPTTAEIINQNEPETEIQISGDGYYDVGLNVQTEIGCQVEIFKEDAIRSGVIADFDLPSASCESNNIDVINRSSLFPEQYQWSVDNGAEVKNNLTDSNLSVHFPQTGTFGFELITTNDIGCRDTTQKSISIEPFEAEFFSPDTAGKCSPAHITFEAEGINADSYYWDFGDGRDFHTNRTSFQHLYNLHNLDEYRNYFDVKMVYSSDYGCSDTIRKEEYISVYGPIAEMEIIEPEGCDPHQVDFKDHSIEATSTYINYGDGTEIDSSSVKSHEYTTKNKNTEFESFSPHLIATDDRDCHDAYFPDEDIVIYNNPIQGYEVEDTRGCAPFTTTFHADNQLTDEVFWDFNNNGKIDDTGFTVTHTFTRQGDLSVRQLAENQYGCLSDTVFEEVITVDPVPFAEIVPVEDIICFEDILTLDESSEPVVAPLKEWKWNISGPDGYEIQFIERTPEFNFPYAGHYDAELIVTDEFGCTDTAANENHFGIQDTLPPKNDGIRFVTIENDQYPLLSWYPSEDTIFSHYTLVKDQIDNILASYDDPEKTNYHDRSASIREEVNCYNAAVTDQCELFSGYNDWHCPVQFHADFLDSVSNLLTWTPYIGWEEVDAYRIYRKKENGQYEQIAEVPGTDTFYVDENLCNIEHCYYVEAVHPEKGYFSRSNTDCHTPPYTFNEEPPYLRRTTVVNDEHILTEWEANESRNFKEYKVKRYSPSGLVNKEFTTTDQEITDQDVDVHSNWYTYRVTRKDICNNQTEPGNQGTSILLSSNIDDFDYARHNWNPYEYWPAGIKSYQLQHRTENGNFITIEPPIDRDQTNIEESSPHEDIRDEHCYRLIAEKNTTDSVFSMSNIDCSPMPSRVFVPNAFSPNDDGTNDEFEVSALGIYNLTGDPSKDFRMQIFTRWGELIFETNDVDDSWDGKHNGELVEEGVYLYSVTATGYDGKEYQLQGDVTLIR